VQFSSLGVYDRLHPIRPPHLLVYTSASPVTRWRNSCNPLRNQKITRIVTKVISAGGCGNLTRQPSGR